MSTSSRMHPLWELRCLLLLLTLLLLTLLRQAQAGDSDSDEDVSFAQIILRKANAWVEMHAKNAKLDRTQDEYPERVKRLLAGGATDRNKLERRTRSGVQRWKETSEVYQATLTAARIYYDQESHCRTIRPWKVCGARTERNREGSLCGDGGP